jgi:hypothetical protein
MALTIIRSSYQKVKPPLSLTLPLAGPPQADFFKKDSGQARMTDIG